MSDYNYLYSKQFDSSGSLTANQPPASIGNAGILEQIGQELNPTIDGLAKRLSEVMAKLTDGAGTSSPAVLAEYQQVYGEYVQALSVRGSAVEKMNTAIEKMLQKM